MTANCLKSFAVTIISSAIYYKNMENDLFIFFETHLILVVLFVFLSIFFLAINSFIVKLFTCGNYSILGWHTMVICLFASAIQAPDIAFVFLLNIFTTFITYIILDCTRAVSEIPKFNICNNARRIFWCMPIFAYIGLFCLTFHISCCPSSILPLLVIPIFSSLLSLLGFCTVKMQFKNILMSLMCTLSCFGFLMLIILHLSFQENLPNTDPTFVMSISIFLCLCAIIPITFVFEMLLTHMIQISRKFFRGYFKPQSPYIASFLAVFFIFLTLIASIEIPRMKDDRFRERHEISQNKLNGIYRIADDLSILIDNRDNLTSENNTKLNQTNFNYDLLYNRLNFLIEVILKESVSVPLEEIDRLMEDVHNFNLQKSDDQNNKIIIQSETLMSYINSIDSNGILLDSPRFEMEEIQRLHFALYAIMKTYSILGEEFITEQEYDKAIDLYLEMFEFGYYVRTAKVYSVENNVCLPSFETAAIRSLLKLKNKMSDETIKRVIISIENQCLNSDNTLILIPFEEFHESSLNKITYPFTWRKYLILHSKRNLEKKKRLRFTYDYNQVVIISALTLFKASVAELP